MHGRSQPFMTHVDGILHPTLCFSRNSQSSGIVDSPYLFLSQEGQVEISVGVVTVTSTSCCSIRVERVPQDLQLTILSVVCSCWRVTFFAPVSTFSVSLKCNNFQQRAFGTFLPVRDAHWAQRIVPHPAALQGPTYITYTEAQALIRAVRWSCAAGAWCDRHHPQGHRGP